jgi:Asp-tRNA(Asn)/Glu-tRNA(Gln) amidotransferase A subunit family amidase
MPLRHQEGPQGQLISGSLADPASADEPVTDYVATLGQGVKGLRIGLIRHFYTKDVAGDPEQSTPLEAAVRLFAAAGAETSEITLPPLQDFGACGQIILAAEAYAVHEQWLKERPQDYGARARERLLAGAGLRCRLSPGGALAAPAPRPGDGGVREHRCGDYRLQHGPRLPDRRRRGSCR